MADAPWLKESREEGPGRPHMSRLSHSLDINVVLRKLVCLLKPDKEIIHTGDHMVIRTITSLRDYVMDFDLGVQFEEDLGPVDGRKCQVRNPRSAVSQEPGVC